METYLVPQHLERRVRRCFERVGGDVPSASMPESELSNSPRLTE